MRWILVALLALLAPDADAVNALRCNDPGAPKIQVTSANSLVWSNITTGGADTGWMMQAKVCLDQLDRNLWESVFTTRSAAQANSTGWYADTGGGTPGRAAFVLNDGATIHYSDAALTTETTCHMYTLRYTGTQYIMYQGTTAISTAATLSSPATVNDGVLWVCDDDWYADETLDGWVSELRIFSSDKGTTFIGETNDCRIKSTTAGLYAYYRFDEASGTTASPYGSANALGNITLVANATFGSNASMTFAGDAGADCGDDPPPNALCCSNP